MERTGIVCKSREPGIDTNRRQVAGILALCLVIVPFVVTSYGAPLVQRSETKTEMAAAKFPKLVAEYLQDLHSRHPALAAASGIHAWDGDLEDYSAQAISAESAAIKAFQA